MKYNILDEGCPIRVVYGASREIPPMSPGKKGQSKEILFPMLRTIVFTDGKVGDVHQKEYHNLSSNYTMNGQTYLGVNTLREDKVFLDGYSYVIMLTVAKEWFNGKKVGGYHEVIRDAQIYLKKTNDKNAMKEIKKVLNIIKTSGFYDSDAMNRLAYSFEFDKRDKNLYTLKRSK